MCYEIQTIYHCRHTSTTTIPCCDTSSVWHRIEYPCFSDITWSSDDCDDCQAKKGITPKPQSKLQPAAEQRTQGPKKLGAAERAAQVFRELREEREREEDEERKRRRDSFIRGPQRRSKVTARSADGTGASENQPSAQEEVSDSGYDSGPGIKESTPKEAAVKGPVFSESSPCPGPGQTTFEANGRLNRPCSGALEQFRQPKEVILSWGYRDLNDFRSLPYQEHGERAADSFRLNSQTCRSRRHNMLKNRYVASDLISDS